MGAYNFELLDVNHVPTHYVGVRLPDRRRGADLGEARRPTPPRGDGHRTHAGPGPPHADGSYDYDAYHAGAGDNYLIPLEIVFRNRVGVGSSLRSRTEPADHGLDYDTWPEEVVDLDEPIVEFSTKYEEQDRYLDREAADRIAGAASIDRLEELARAVNHVVTERPTKPASTTRTAKSSVSTTTAPSRSATWSARSTKTGFPTAASRSRRRSSASTTSASSPSGSRP